jgi:hypothetical protein
MSKTKANLRERKQATKASNESKHQPNESKLAGKKTNNKSKQQKQTNILMGSTILSNHEQSRVNHEQS